MYEDFYGLESKPFLLSPDPHFYFGSKQHRRAVAYLEYGISCEEGFVVVTGDIGAGKTTILRALIDGLHGSNVMIGQLLTTQLDADDTLRMVAAAFGLNVKDVRKSELLITLEAFLLSQAASGQRCLLIVDEAQNLTTRAVEELRMLSNFQYGKRPLLQTFLVGQPEFREILRRPEMMQFRQRIAATCHLGPLDGGETRRYIEHRLKCANSSDKPTFDDEAFEAIFDASGGVPRRINSICDRLLLLGFLKDRTHFSPSEVAEVVNEFSEEASAPEPVHAMNGSSDAAAALPTGEGESGPIDLSRIGLAPATALRLERHLATLGAEEQQSQLQRIELGLLRLERINQHVLATLRKLLLSVQVPPENAP
jgi:general secretion pathway protein A